MCHACRDELLSRSAADWVREVRGETGGHRRRRRPRHRGNRRVAGERELSEALGLSLGTTQKALGRLSDRTPPPAIGGKRFRAYYSVQTGTRPYRIKIFCNQERSLTESYRRYLEVYQGATRS